MQFDQAWQEFLANHAVGDVIEGVVTAVKPFGSFVESAGVTGLAPGLNWPVGSTVAARILAVDEQNQRFSLAAS